MRSASSISRGGPGGGRCGVKLAADRQSVRWAARALESRPGRRSYEYPAIGDGKEMSAKVVGGRRRQAAQQTARL